MATADQSTDAKKLEGAIRVDPRKIHVRAGWNYRVDYGNIDELKDSIIANGVLNPLLVRKLTEDEYELIAGHRRLKGTMKAIAEGVNIETVPAIVVRKGMSDLEALINSLLENDSLQPSPVEEATAFDRLRKYGLTAEEIARRLGRRNHYVEGRLKLIDASPEVIKAYENREIKLSQVGEIVDAAEGSFDAQATHLAVIKEENRTSGPPTLRERNTPNEAAKRGSRTMKAADIRNLFDDLVKMYDEENYRGPAGKADLEGRIRALALVLRVDVPFKPVPTPTELGALTPEKLPYAFTMRWNDIEKCYVVTSPDLPALRATGQTMAAAADEAKEMALCFMSSEKAPRTSPGQTTPLPRELTPYVGEIREIAKASQEATAKRQAEQGKA